MTHKTQVTDELIRCFGRTRARINIALIEEQVHEGICTEAYRKLNRRLRQVDAAWEAFQATH